MSWARPLPAVFILATLTACGRDAAPREVTSRAAGTPSNVAAGSSVSEAPKGEPLIFPSGKLKSAEVQCWRLGGEWEPVDLETANDLISALSENYRYFRPENVICILFTAPKWSFRFNWSDGTSMVVPLTAEGAMIRGSETEHDGVRGDVDHGTYVVESKRVAEILKRCPSIEEFTRETCAVCGTSVRSNIPFAWYRGARIFYFCGQEHLDRFAQGPESNENGPESSQSEEPR